jgi:hypothetical protein
MLQHQNRSANHRKACDVGPYFPHVGICWTSRGYFIGSVPPVSAVLVLPVVGSDSWFDDKLLTPNLSHFSILVHSVVKDEEFQQEISGGEAFLGSPFLTINAPLCPAVNKNKTGNVRITYH